MRPVLGGWGTIIGTPTNAILIAHLSEMYNIDVSFAKWLLCFFPLVIILIISMWVYLSVFQLKNVSLGSVSSNDFVKQKLEELGKMTYEERSVSLIFTLLAFLWIFKSYLPATVSDSAIGIGCCSLFFIINAKSKEGCLLNWDDTKNLPWGILILFGGGMALAKGLEKSGVIELVTLYFDYLQIKSILVTIIFFYSDSNYIY